MATQPPKIRAFNVQEWISKSEAAKLRGISRQAIWELVRRGRLSTFEFAHRIYLNRSEVLNFQRRPRGPASDYETQRLTNYQTYRRKKKKSIDPAKWVSKIEAGNILGITRQAVSDLIKRRRLKAMVVENRTYVSRAGIEKFQTEQANTSPKSKHPKKK